MTLDQAIDILTVAAVFDFRSIGEADAVAWHAVLSDLEFGDARAAVLAHYTESCDRVMPADIRRRVRAVRRERLAREAASAPPPELTDEPGRYKAALQAGIRRIADGFSARCAIGHLADEPPPPAAEVRKALGPALPAPGRTLPPQEIARRQVAESRAARGAAVAAGEPA